MVLGLSDHTPGHATALGSVALGGRIVEKHFTDDNSRVGPDHPFSMTPESWQAMVENTRLLERALGSPKKFVAENEATTVVVQRRGVRAARQLPEGTILTREDLVVLRPAPRDAITADDLASAIGMRVCAPVGAGVALRWDDLGRSG